VIRPLIQYFKDKKILILGFGREGISTYKLIRKYLSNQHLTIADKNSNFEKDYDFLACDPYLTIISGENYLDNLDNYDIIMKAPGISFAYLDTSSYFSKIKSQLELFLEFFPVFTIGVTGTKGKSTTSSLIYQILKDQNIKCMLLGNIGVPVFDCIDTLEENTTAILEMSSHQLEYMEVSPNIALLLNLYEEHLDHYESFEQYAKAKCNIYKYQTKSDYFLYSFDNENLAKFVHDPCATTYSISLKNSQSTIFLKNDIVYLNNKPLYSKNTSRNLVGDYNLNNIMFALGVSEILQLDLSKTVQSISKFKTLAHRLQFVGKYDDILFYDNSIATIPMATIEAIEALKNVDTLIIGGMDRGIHYEDFINYLNHSSIRNVICMPKTGHDIALKLKSEKSYVVETLEEAVSIAKKITAKNKICLLSPAAASYGFFKNFEEKGNLYQKLVKDI